MTATEAEKRAIKKWMNKSIHYIKINFNKVKDKEMIEWLETKSSKSAYIKKLIEEDMKKAHNF